MVAMEAASGLLPSLGRLQPADVACCGSGINVWKNSLRMNRFSPPHAEHDRIHPPDGQQDWPRAPRSTRSQACQSPLQAHAGRRLVHPCSSSTKKFIAAADKRSATAVSMLSCWPGSRGNGSSRKAMNTKQHEFSRIGAGYPQTVATAARSRRGSPPELQYVAGENAERS